MAKNYLHLSRNAYISNTAALFFAASFDYSLEASISKATTLADLLEKKGLATWTPQPQEKPKKAEAKKQETVLTANIVVDYQPVWSTLTVRNASTFTIIVAVDGKISFPIPHYESVIVGPKIHKLTTPSPVLEIRAFGREEYKNTLTITKSGPQEFLVDLRDRSASK